MAGVKQFDVDQVLDQALQVFWRQGYTATSIQDLTEATGIGRGSLYGAFGDKEQLFQKVLERYTQQFADPPLQALQHQDPLQGIADMFAVMADRMSNPTCPRGCLQTNTTLECPMGVESIQRISAQWLGTLEAALYETLRRAQVQGQLEADRDIRALARFLVGVSQGMAVVHKVNADPSYLQDMIQMAMTTLRGSPSSDRPL
jgi:TetR/AcrR family transcriptional repressor of nem operon